jgi:hypothetical protein
MALYLEFDRIVRAFNRAKLRYAVAGGFAVGLHGYIRATQDMDFLVHEDDFPKAEATLTQLGYRANPEVQDWKRAGLTLMRFLKGLPKEDDLMVVDLIIPRSVRMKGVLRRAIRVPYRRSSLPVVPARDLVAMKRLRGSTADKAETDAEQIVRRISDLRDLARRLAQAGFQSGLHGHDPSRVTSANAVAKAPGKYKARKQKTEH